MIQFANIPAALRERDQWVLWKTVERDGKPTKIPLRTDGEAAKSNDPETWAPFARVKEAYGASRHGGPAFVFCERDPFVGIDLDGCRDPETKKVSEWAREIILKFGSYAEVSPSNTGVKIFACGDSPFPTGKNLKLPHLDHVCDKAPGIEVYDTGRYFAVTGLRLTGPTEPTDGTDALTWLKAKYWPDEPARRGGAAWDFQSEAAVADRARKFIAKIPPAVSGQGGHNRTFHVACVLVIGFGLSEDDALVLIAEWNLTCSPPWSERELEHKVRDAAKQSGERNYLRNAKPANWSSIKIPTYKAPPVPQPSSARATTLADATQKYIDKLRSGEETLASTSIPELDYALGGGLGFGEMVLFAARPSHGKSAVALQCLHHWTAGDAPGVMVSEEMGALALGKRTLQHLTPLSESDWPAKLDALEDDLSVYRALHKDCFIVEGCGTAEAAAAAIEEHVQKYGTKYAVVDYAQLLRSDGRTRYEQVTNTSIQLRQLASRLKILLLVLCQLSRGIEQRAGEFMPVMSDLKDSGQLEQDADVIVFLCWPHKLNSAEPLERYQFFIAKNRNREIRMPCVECEFIPSRQMFREMPPEEFRRQMAERGEGSEAA
jgi:hypothetical protein